MAENIIKNQIIKHMNFKELILKNHENATVVACIIGSLKMINCKRCTIVGNSISHLSIGNDSVGNFFGLNVILKGEGISNELTEKERIEEIDKILTVITEGRILELNRILELEKSDKDTNEAFADVLIKFTELENPFGEEGLTSKQSHRQLWDRGNTHQGRLYNLEKVLRKLIKDYKIKHSTSRDVADELLEELDGKTKKRFEVDSLTITKNGFIYRGQEYILFNKDSEGQTEKKEPNYIKCEDCWFTLCAKNCAGHGCNKGKPKEVSGGEKELGRNGDNGLESHKTDQTNDSKPHEPNFLEWDLNYNEPRENDDKCAECGGFRMGESIMHNDGCSKATTTTQIEPF